MIKDNSDNFIKTTSLRRITHAVSSKFNKITENIKPKRNKKTVESNEEIDNVSYYETLRFQADYFVKNSSIGYFYTQLVLWLCTLSCLQFIYSTYTNVRTPGTQYFQLFQTLELTIASILMFDWILHFSLAQNKMKYSFSFYSIIDLLTLVPIYSTYNVACPNVDQLSDIVGYVYYTLCGLNCFR